MYAASAGELMSVLRTLPNQATDVVFVGHNPGFEDLAAQLMAGRAPSAWSPGCVCPPQAQLTSRSASNCGKKCRQTADACCGWSIRGFAEADQVTSIGPNILHL